MIRTRPHAASTAAALFALLMLSFASVQSIVMQVSMAAPGEMMPICGKVDPSNAMAVEMAGMDMQLAMASHDHHPGAPDQHHAACPYCSAAAHAPILGESVPIRQATQCVFTAFEQTVSLGPRGPPTILPRARGPPANPLIA